MQDGSLSTGGNGLIDIQGHETLTSTLELSIYMHQFVSPVEYSYYIECILQPGGRTGSARPGPKLRLTYIVTQDYSPRLVAFSYVSRMIKPALEFCKWAAKSLMGINLLAKR